MLAVLCITNVLYIRYTITMQKSLPPAKNKWRSRLKKHQMIRHGYFTSLIMVHENKKFIHMNLNKVTDWKQISLLNWDHTYSKNTPWKMMYSNHIMRSFYVCKFCILSCRNISHSSEHITKIKPTWFQNSAYLAYVLPPSSTQG